MEYFVGLDVSHSASRSGPAAMSGYQTPTGSVEWKLPMASPRLAPEP